MPLTLLIAAADLVAALWLVSGWRRQRRHREFYILVVAALLAMCGWLAVLGLT